MFPVPEITTLLFTALLAGLGLVPVAVLAGAFVRSGGDDTERALDRFLGAWLAIAALAGAIVTPLGLLGLLDRPLAPTGVLAACSVGVLLARRHDVTESVRQLAESVRRTAGLLFALRAEGATGRLALLALAVPASALLLAELVMPPNSWDALTYHLTYPLHWYRSGALETFPFPVGERALEYFPLLGESLFYWGFLATGSDGWTDIAQVPALLAAGAAIAGIARRCGAGPRASSLAALLWMSLPLVLRSAFEAMVDVLLASFLLAAVFFLLRWERDGRPASLVAAFLGAGLAAGTKYLGALYLGALTPVALVLLVRHVRRGGGAASLVRAILFGTLLAVVVGGYAYARNLWMAGNPLLPMEVRIGGTTILPGALGPEAFYESALRRLTFAGFLFSPRALLDFGPGFVLFLALPLVALGRGARSRGSAATTVAAAAAMLWLLAFLVVLPYRLNRFVLAPAGLCCALSAVLPRAVRKRLPWMIVLDAPFALYYWGKDIASGGLERVHFLLVAVLALAGATILGGCSSGTLRFLRRLRPARVALAVTLVLAAVPAQRMYREARYERWVRSWSHRTVSGQGFRRREDLAETARVWQRIAALTEDAPAAVAYCGNNLPYPLAGLDLRNRVVFVPRHAVREDAFLGWERRDFTAPRVEDPDAWIANLRAFDVRYLCVFRLYAEDDPERRLPIEARWAGRRPDLFERIHESDEALVYRVASSGPGEGAGA